MIKSIVKLKTIVIILVNTEVLHIAYAILDLVYLQKFMCFSNYGNHFTIKKLAKEFEREFNFLG